MTKQLSLMVFVVLLIASTMSRAEEASRVFSFEYKTTIDSIEAGSGSVQVFIPLAVESDQQHIISEKIDSSLEGRIEVEEAYGNRYWHGSLVQADGVPIAVTVTTVVERKTSRVQTPAMSRPITDQERMSMAKFLGANAKVVVGHPVLKPILAEVEEMAGSKDPAAISRAIYDWVVDNVEYKKVGSGWGNGDTFWACSERYGNCTDFHALFISLARSEGIPARFEIGFPVPDSRDSGVIGGYHCWVEFYLPGTGWFPIDASEASKHPEKREYFYGSHPGDRIHFSTGRDLKLGAAHKGQSLNYLVYPYVEVDEKPFEGKVERSFSYQSINAAL